MPIDRITNSKLAALEASVVEIRRLVEHKDPSQKTMLMFDELRAEMARNSKATEDTLKELRSLSNRSEPVINFFEGGQKSKQFVVGMATVIIAIGAVVGGLVAGIKYLSR